ncbi:hypothetical protein ACYATO_08410 [Lactobacillaceae bacterium Melli_B3]
MTLNATGTINISKNYNWGAIKKHAEHDPNINHSNKDIEFENTKYNSQGQLLNYDELMTARYSDYVKEHDEKMIKSRHKKDVYGTVDNYLSKMKNQPYMTMVATFGDMKLKDKVYSITNSKDSVLKDYNDALVDYISGFNERNSELKITEYVTNVDEKGAPHIHAQIVPMGRTKKGNPSTSLTSALNIQYGTKDSREALRMFRAQEDQEVINSFNRFFGYPESNEKAFSLIRTGKKGGRPMPEYQENQKKIAEQYKEIKNKSIEIYRLDNSIKSKKKIKSAFDKEIEKGIYESYFNLTDAEFYQSESMSDEIVPKLASGEKSFDPIDDSVHDGAGDNEKTFSGLGLISKFNNMYVESLLRFEESLYKLKNKLINQYKSSVENLIRKEHSLHDFAEKLSKRESNMNDAERKALEDIESKNIDGSIKDFNPKNSSILNDFRDSNQDAVNDLKKAKKPQKRHAINLSADGTKLVMSKDAFSNNQNQERGNQPPRNPRLFGR